MRDQGRFRFWTRCHAAVQDNRIASCPRAERWSRDLWQQAFDERGDLQNRNQFIREVFGRYMTDDVVETLLESSEGLQLGGERRKVTVMMSDLRGFSSISERMSPEQVVSMLGDGAAARR